MLGGSPRDVSSVARCIWRTPVATPVKPHEHSGLDYKKNSSFALFSHMRMRRGVIRHLWRKISSAGWLLPIGCRRTLRAFFQQRRFDDEAGGDALFLGISCQYTRP